MASLLSIGTRAMFANNAQLQTIGNNISNANTPGYSRQDVQLVNESGNYTGSGFFGRGVKVQTVVRSHNEFLTKEAAASKAFAAADESRVNQLKQLEKLFPVGDSGIGAAAESFFNSFADVASLPQDSSARQVALSRAAELAARMRSAGGQINSLQAGVKSDVESSLKEVNSLAKQVADLNQQIARYQGSDHTPNDLLDQRDKVINEINGYMQVTTLDGGDGTVGLFIGGGQRLVLGNQATTLVGTRDAYDGAKIRVSVAESGTTREIDSNSLTGGSIAGLLRFQDQDLNDARNMLGQMAAAISQEVNKQQALGLDLGTPPGAGAAIFSVGAPRVLPASTNSNNVLPTVTVDDATFAKASDYELTFDGGSWQLKRLSDSSVTDVTGTIGAGGSYSVDGITIGPMSGASTPGDRWLIQPLAEAAQDMQRTLTDPRGIAAASPISGTVGTANTGTAAVNSLYVVDNTLDPTQSYAFTFTSDTGDYNYTIYDNANNPVGGGSGTWTAGQPIALGGFELNLAGVPKTNDTINIAPTQFPNANNGNARALLNLRDADLIGRTQTLAGTTPGLSASSAYAAAMADIGVRVQSAEGSFEISQSVADNAQAQLTNEVGVNLDEEAARLIQYQQAYQAAAKILQVAQSVFDTLLNVAR